MWVHEYNLAAQVDRVTTPRWRNAWHRFCHPGAYWHLCAECGRAVDFDTQQPLSGASVRYGIDSDGAGRLDVQARSATDGSFCRLLSAPAGSRYTVAEATAAGYESVASWEHSGVSRPLTRNTVQQAFRETPAPTQLPLLQLREASSA